MLQFLSGSVAALLTRLAAREPRSKPPHISRQLALDSADQNILERALRAMSKHGADAMQPLLGTDALRPGRQEITISERGQRFLSLLLPADP